MNWSSLRGLVACFALGTTVTAMRGAELPFAIDTRDGQWKAAPVQKLVAPGITFEVLVAHVSGAERLVILSSPLADAGSESLGDFARRLKDSFSGYRNAAEVKERDAEWVGYRGRELIFDLVNEKEAFDCELFVFADEKNRWGVLHSKLKSALAVAGAPSAFSLLQKKTAPATGVVGLAPFRVKEPPVTGFPITFNVRRSPGSSHVAEIVVTEVPEGSSTERHGVKVGDKIVSVNGRKTPDFPIGVGKDSEIGRIFLNRHPGDEVTLELVSAATGKIFTVTLRVPTPRFNLDMLRMGRDRDPD